MDTSISPKTVSQANILDRLSQLKISDDAANKKRESYLSWEDYFMSLAVLSSKRSKDPSTQVHWNFSFFRIF